MSSLQGRLQFGLGVALSLLMVVVWWLVNASLDHISERQVQTRMEHDAEALLASLTLGLQGELAVDESMVGLIYQRVFSGHYYTVSRGDQLIRSRSLWDQTLGQIPLSPGESYQGHAVGPDNQYLLVWSAAYKRIDQVINITIAEDVTPLYQDLKRFNIAFAIGSAVILVILLWVQRAVVRYSFTSLDRVTDELEKLAEGEVEALSEQVPTEVRPLVLEVNQLLKLLAGRLQRSRNAVGNLAHSLKHPLNLLMQLTEREALRSYPELRDELQRTTRQITQLMERELKRARLAGAGMPGQRFVADQELPNLVDVLQRVYRDKDLAIQLEIEPGLEYPADRNDMLELLGNLMDNACKWSRGLVMLALCDQQQLRVTVEDDGPGCDDAQLDRLTQRGVRTDEAVDGSGLGLSIVKEIVQLYQGTIKFERSDQLGGLKVSVGLPFRPLPTVERSIHQGV